MEKRMNREQIEAIASQAREDLTEAGAALVVIVVADDDNHGVIGGCTGVGLDVLAQATGTFVLSMVDKVTQINGKAAALMFLDGFLDQLKKLVRQDCGSRTTDLDADFTDLPMISKAVH